MKNVAAGITAILVAIGILVYGSFALYEGSWSLAKHNTQHSLEIQQQVANGQASIAANGWNYQSMLGSEITNGIDAVDHDTTDIASAKAQGLTSYADSLIAQRSFDASKVCDQASQINGTLPPGMFQTTWINTNCDGGNLKPSSVYYATGN